MEPIKAIGLPPFPAAPSVKPASAGEGFGTAIERALTQVSGDQARAESLQKAFQLGDPDVGLEETMVATSSANLSFQALVAVRSRLVSAYQEIMNMQV